MPAPKYGSEPLDRKTGLFTREWYTYLTSLVSSEASSPALDPNLEALARVEGWGFYVRTRFGALVRRLTSSTLQITSPAGQEGDPAIDLAALADSGVGASLVKITRDTYGRVAGTQTATAADLAYDNTTSGLAATDTQAAIDELAASASAQIFNRIDAAGDIRVDAEGNLRITS